jgi:hypothetical protein
MENNKKIPLSAITFVIESLLRTDSWKSTKFLDKKLVVRATRKLFDRKILNGDIEIVLKIGKPNFEERKIIKKGYPIKGVVLKKIPIKK